MPASERPLCGDCKFFDRNRVDGSQFQTKFGGEGGACRTNKGLRFGVLSPDSPCRQTEGIFQRKEGAVPPVVPPKAA